MQSPTIAYPAAPLAACVQRNVCTKTNKISLPWPLASRDRKTISDWSSTAKPEHLAKIGPIDFEIIGLTAIVNNKYKITNRSRTYNPRACFQQPGGLKCVRKLKTNSGMLRRNETVTARVRGISPEKRDTVYLNSISQSFSKSKLKAEIQNVHFLRFQTF